MMLSSSVKNVSCMLIFCLIQAYKMIVQHVEGVNYFFFTFNIYDAGVLLLNPYLEHILST